MSDKPQNVLALLSMCSQKGGDTAITHSAVREAYAGDLAEIKQFKEKIRDLRNEHAAEMAGLRGQLEDVSRKHDQVLKRIEAAAEDWEQSQNQGQLSPVLYRAIAYDIRRIGQPSYEESQPQSEQFEKRLKDLEDKYNRMYNNVREIDVRTRTMVLCGS